MPHFSAELQYDKMADLPVAYCNVITLAVQSVCLYFSHNKIIHDLFSLFLFSFFFCFSKRGGG